MIFSAIDLKDDAAVEDEVDSADAVNPDLTLEEDAEAVKPQPQNGLESALRVGPGDVDQPPKSRW